MASVGDVVWMRWVECVLVEVGCEETSPGEIDKDVGDELEE